MFDRSRQFHAWAAAFATCLLEIRRSALKSRLWFQYLVEVFFATYGPMIASAMLIYTLFPVAKFADHNLNFWSFNRILSLHYFPLQCALSALCGCKTKMSFKTPLTYWVWIGPTLFLASCMYRFPTGVFDNQWTVLASHFFGSQCRPPQCFDQMRCTAPFLTSLAYMLGAFWYESVFHMRKSIE
jgi:hypothetical protein